MPTWRARLGPDLFRVWFLSTICLAGTIGQADVSYDHPFHIALDHALNIDFANESLGPGARIAVELDVDSARNLARTILQVLEEAQSGGYLTIPDEKTD